MTLPLAGISVSQQAKVKVRDHGAERPNQPLSGKMERKPTEGGNEKHFSPVASTDCKSRADQNRLKFSTGT